MKIQSVLEPAFCSYGRVIAGYPLDELLRAMENTPCPDEVIYVPSDPALEALPICKALRDREFGGLDIQIGYCNGKNRVLNALEYHKNSEINIACTDMLLMLGHVWDMEGETYDTAKVEFFSVPKGTMIELYATTLHYAPCNTVDKFRCVVVLPRGTNRPLEETQGDGLLFAKNKWLLAHPEAGICGAKDRLLGENLSLTDRAI